MPLSIHSSMLSAIARHQALRHQRTKNRSGERLASGLRLNRAADDAAGLAISEQLRARVGGHTQAGRNTGSALAMVRTAESGAGSISDTLVRMRELAMQAANGALSSTDRSVIDTEYQALLEEVNRLSETTETSGQELLGGAASTISFQVGIDSGASSRIDVGFGGVSTTSLGIAGSSVAGSDGSGASTALGAVDAALEGISLVRARFGASMSRLETAESFSLTTRTELEAARSAIADTDVAAEAAAFARAQVGLDATTSLLAAANQLPTLTLSLLSG